MKVRLMLALVGIAWIAAACGPEMNEQQGEDAGLAHYRDGLMPELGTTVASRGSMGPAFMTEALNEAQVPFRTEGLVPMLNGSVGGVTPNAVVAKASAPKTSPQPSVSMPAQATVPTMPNSSTPPADNASDIAMPPR